MKTMFHAALGLLALWTAPLPAQTSGPWPNTTVAANVTLTVNTGAATGVTALAHVEFLDYYAVRSQAAPWRDSAGRYILDATVDPAAVVMIYPPPPKPVVDLTYRLGVIPAGTYTAVFRMNGKVFAEKAFTVAPVPPPPVPNAQVTMQVLTAASGTLAKARVVFPDGYWVLSDPGMPQRSGTGFVIPAKASRIETLVPPTAPTVFEPQYSLGVLPAGGYSITYQINGIARGVFPFTVQPPPLPQLAFINFLQGDVSMAAEVGVTLPSGVTVSHWGEVARNDSSFKVALTFGPSTLTDTTTNVGPTLLRHTYSLGIVGPGAYRMTVTDTADARVLGTREFTVGSPPPPPPPAPPIVAYIQPGQDSTTGWFVEVGLAFLRPGLEVKSWGVPAREGKLFQTKITWGPAMPPVTTTDPVLGGSPVFYCPPETADEPLSVVDATVCAPFNQIGGWPSRLVRHRYGLGKLEPGEYVFVVNLDGRDAARRTWVVPTVGTPGPQASLVAPPLTTATTDPYAFRILFNAPAGWDGEPGKGKVTVTGPNNFSGVAQLVSSVPSLDPLGRLFDCTYALSGPGGAWDAADNGAYRVFTDPAAVIDRDGRTLPRPCIGEFKVWIQPMLPPTKLPVQVAVEMRDGRWFANVAFDNTGGWFAPEWGEVRMNGNVFAAMAVLRQPPPGSMMPIQASFEHSYLLGSPPPGKYAFAFRSNAGHLAVAPFEVPGVEPPTPLKAWAMTTATRDETGVDDDGDGWSNRAEYYLGMRPLAGDQPALQPKLVDRNGARRLALEFRRLHGVEAPVGVGVEVSRDLFTWIDAGDMVDWVPGPPEADGTQAVEVIQKPSSDGRQWPFMRLRVEE